MNYSEYIAANLDKNIKYTEYLAEHLDKNIKYAEYVAESLNNMQYGEYTNEDPTQKKRKMREKKLNRIFKDFEPEIIDTKVETPVEKKSPLHDIKMWFYK